MDTAKRNCITNFRMKCYLEWALRGSAGGGRKAFWRAKKKRGGSRLLSRVEVSELRLWKSAAIPRPSQLRPVPQTSVPGIRSRVFYSRLSLSTSFGLSTPLGCASSRHRRSGLRLNRLPVLPARAFRSVGLQQPKLPTNLSIFLSRSSFRSSDLSEPKLFPVRRPAEEFTSWRLSQGIASPFRVTRSWYDRL